VWAFIDDIRMRAGSVWGIDDVTDKQTLFIKHSAVQPPYSSVLNSSSLVLFTTANTMARMWMHTAMANQDKRRERERERERQGSSELGRSRVNFLGPSQLRAPLRVAAAGVEQVADKGGMDWAGSWWGAPTHLGLDPPNKMEGGRYLGKGLMMIRDLQVALEGGRGVERRKRKRKEKRRKK
jgi:hypothetical protein